MPDDEVKTRLVGRSADERAAAGRFLANWGYVHGRETAEVEAVPRVERTTCVVVGEG